MSHDLRELLLTLERLAALFDGSGSVELVPDEIRERRRQHAIATVERRDATEAIALLEFAADMLAAAAPALAARPEAAPRVLAQVESITGIGRLALGRQVFRSPALLQLLPGSALGQQLFLLQAFTGARAAALWTSAPRFECLVSAGELDDRRAAEAARAVLATGRLVDPDHVGCRLHDVRGHAAALIARRCPGDERSAPMLEAASCAVVVALDRWNALAERGDGQSIVTAVERRLARLRYDLHDGPQQDVQLLAMDLALFREQLLPIVARDPNAERVLGRLEDLAAQLVALDGDLRRLSAYVQSPFVHAGSLADALHEITDAFTTRAGIRPRIELSGEFDDLTESQQLTLLALIREALSNIREHSNARHVRVTVTARESGVQAEIVDDGHGFDPEATLVRAARDGHLGLVGMHERVRMLGGRTQIDSRPGGPTVISASLPRWPREE